MTVGWGIIGFLIALVVALVLTTVGDLVSEELRSRLHRMPYAVLRMAIRRLPAELRQNVGGEWLAELHYVLRRAQGLPLTRLVLAIRFTLGLLRTARRIGRELQAVRSGAAPVPQKPSNGFLALRRITLVGGITVSLTTVGTTATDGILGITSAPVLATYVVQATQRVSPIPTFWDASTLTGRGPAVQPGQQVEVLCRVHVPNSPASTQPGWWYLINSSPWSAQYYTVANSYLNGDAPEGPYLTEVDTRVPVC